MESSVDKEGLKLALGIIIPSACNEQLFSTIYFLLVQYLKTSSNIMCSNSFNCAVKVTFC